MKCSLGFHLFQAIIGPTQVTTAREKLKSWIDVIALMMFKTAKKIIVATGLDTVCVWKLLSDHMS